MVNGMVQNRDSPDCVTVDYQGEFQGFEVGNAAMAILVAHKARQSRFIVSRQPLSQFSWGGSLFIITSS